MLRIILQASKPTLVRLADAKADTCGAKAAACAELERAAAGSGAGFATPAAAVVPFGVMDLAIQVRVEISHNSNAGVLSLCRRSAADAVAVRQHTPPDPLMS